MKRSLRLLVLTLVASPALNAQITITAADMPVGPVGSAAFGDTLRYSVAPAVGLNTSNTGANIAWDFSTLVPQYQAVDTYKTAAQAGYTGTGIPATSFGYKVADTLSFPGAPLSATNVYLFYNTKSSPSRFVAEGFGARLTIIPVSGGYSNEDTIYNFPLTYNRIDSGTFRLSITVPALGSLKQTGKRVTKVDGWGTIVTPFFTTPVQVLRVRSEVTEIDSITFSTQTFGVPRHYVDYQWLANGQHYPVLQINSTIAAGNETPTLARYHDSQRNLLGVSGPLAAYQGMEVYPNPVNGEGLNVNVPAGWSHYLVHLFDMSGRQIAEYTNTSHIPTASLPAGQYVIIADGGKELGLARFVKAGE